MAFKKPCDSQNKTTHLITCFILRLSAIIKFFRPDPKFEIGSEIKKSIFHSLKCKISKKTQTLKSHKNIQDHAKNTGNDKQHLQKQGHCFFTPRICFVADFKTAQQKEGGRLSTGRGYHKPCPKALRTPWNHSWTRHAFCPRGPLPCPLFLFGWCFSQGKTIFWK